MANNQWDKLSAVFNTHKKNKNPAVADNVEILWPLLFKLIKRYKKTPAKVLEYGCGCGGFCKELYLRGCSVTGVDSSKKMISIAKRSCSKKIKYITGDIEDLKNINDQYDVVTAIMVLQFIKNVKPCIDLPPKS